METAHGYRRAEVDSAHLVNRVTYANGVKVGYLDPTINWRHETDRPLVIEHPFAEGVIVRIGTGRTGWRVENVYPSGEINIVSTRSGRWLFVQAREMERLTVVVGPVGLSCGICGRTIQRLEMHGPEWCLPKVEAGQ